MNTDQLVTLFNCIAIILNGIAIIKTNRRISALEIKEPCQPTSKD